MDTNAQPDCDARSLLAASFDAEFYLDTYGVLGVGGDPRDHFLTIGWLQGRDPSPDFSVFNYLIRNDDVLRRHLNPLVHYLRYGRQEGRSAYPHAGDYRIYLPWEPEVADLLPMWFDEDYYLQLNPELKGAPSALAQYLVLGWVEGRDPCAEFSTHKYLWKYSDVMLSGENPLIHYLRVGRNEGREAVTAEGSRSKVSRHLSDGEWLDRVRAEFDPGFYVRMYPSTAGITDLFHHYSTTGWLEGRDPSARFSVRNYLATHGDVRDAGREPLYHYIRFGIFEGRHVFPSEAVEGDAAWVAAAERTDEDGELRAEFDEQFYLVQNPELASVSDLFEHYMTIGWKEGRNPSDTFDTQFYLANEGDIRGAGINPFRHFVLHGRREKRRGISLIPKLTERTDFPKVSVIVPNYNHARFLPARLQSITDQNYANLQLIILDDCSSDNSRDVIDTFVASYTGEYEVVFNEENSGNVFSQWQKGLSLATGELIWICESDDACENDFLHQITYLFQEESLRLAFGDIQFVDEAGKIIEGMSHLRESAEPGIWKQLNIMPASRWFTGPLAVRNLIANVGGAVFRKPHLPDEIWKTAKTFRVAGDWFLYLIIAGGGQIAYAPDARAYFRQHSLNTSVTAFQQKWFYEELGRFHTLLRERWDVPRRATLAFYGNLLETFESSSLSNTIEISELVSLDRLLKVAKSSVHVAMSFINFNIGGGEIFPVELLNVMHRRGLIVSAVVQTARSDNAFVRKWLHPDIPVYVAEDIPYSAKQLAQEAGFDIIHSHNVWSEFYFLSDPEAGRYKYISTLHGSYEVSHVQSCQVATFFDRVSWAYLADRNLAKFRDFGFDTSGFKFIPNGMARRLSNRPVTREALGISPSAFIFLFAARSHPEKGWAESAAAFDLLCMEGDREIVLLMGGAGTEPDLIKAKFAHNPLIQVLGFRSDIDDLLEIVDVMLLPTRFAGESMPLTLIQSILAAKPIISTNVGQIRDMLQSPAGPVGVAIEPLADDNAFIAALLVEMRRAADRDWFVDPACFVNLADTFSMESCANNYFELYGVGSPATLSKSAAGPLSDADVNGRNQRQRQREPARLSHVEVLASPGRKSA